MSDILSTTHLTKHYTAGSADVQALAGVDLVIRRGEFVALMGPSGSGKSTLLHLLGGLDAPDDGEITLAGQRLARLDDDRLSVVRRQQIGFIFQFFNLLPTLTAWENVALPLLIDGQDVRKYTERIDSLLEQVGLADRSHHRPSELSGGQQQRVAIARALVTEPALVLADEPTGNLDSASGKEVLALLRRACDERGQTIVMVTHDQTAAKIADRVIHLRDGQIVK